MKDYSVIVISQVLVMCDKNCTIQWFHFDCLHTYIATIYIKESGMHIVPGEKEILINKLVQLIQKLIQVQ